MLHSWCSFEVCPPQFEVPGHTHKEENQSPTLSFVNKWFQSSAVPWIMTEKQVLIISLIFYFSRTSPQKVYTSNVARLTNQECEFPRFSRSLMWVNAERFWNDAEIWNHAGQLHVKWKISQLLLPWPLPIGRGGGGVGWWCSLVVFKRAGKGKKGECQVLLSEKLLQPPGMCSRRKGTADLKQKSLRITDLGKRSKCVHSSQMFICTVCLHDN